MARVKTRGGIKGELDRARATTLRLAMTQNHLAERSQGRVEALEWVLSLRTTIPPLDDRDGLVAGRAGRPWRLRWWLVDGHCRFTKHYLDRESAERGLWDVIAEGCEAAYITEVVDIELSGVRPGVHVRYIPNGRTGKVIRAASHQTQRGDWVVYWDGGKNLSAVWETNLEIVDVE